MTVNGKSHKNALLLGSAIAAFAFAPIGALAQDEVDEGDIIVVRGIKKSIQDSLAAKRDATSIVEAVSAEDIGKLPDSSIAESLARLPGLTAQRSSGRAKDISVRGLGPDFTTALLNGREQVTAGDNRGVEFDQYPSELLSQAIVYKTPDASLLGQGLAGTVDLRTVRPLDVEPTKSVSARYEWNEYGALNAGSDDNGYRLTGAWFDKNDEGTLGWAVAVSTQSSPVQAERWDAWGYPTVDDGNGGQAFILGGAKPYVESRDLERDAITGTLQYEPSDTIGLTLDAFYSNFKDRGILRGIEFPLQWSGASLQPGYTVENGLVTAGTFNGVQGVVRNDERTLDADLLSLGGNLNWQMRENWRAELDISHSEIKRTFTDLELYSGTGAGFGNGASDNLGFQVTGDGSFTFTPQLNYADASTFRLTDPQGWGQAGFIKAPETDDELNSIRLSAEREFEDHPWISSVELGANFTSRDKRKRSDESFIDLANPGADGTTPIPAELLQGSTSLDFIGIPGMVSFDPMAALNSGVYTLRPNTNPDVITKSWDVNEDVTTVYAQVNISSDWNGVPVRGNIGAQWVDTDQSSTGARVGFVGGQPAFVTYTSGDKYSELLPSLNLSFEVMPDTFVRVGAARTLARARMDQMRASQQVNANNQVCGFNPDGTPFFNAANFDPTGANPQLCLSTDGGNPMLRPYIADGYDLSFEKYFANGTGNFVIAAFYKDVQDFVDGSASNIIDTTDLMTAVFGPAFVAANPDVTIGKETFPTNAGSATIQGIEAQANVPLDIWVPALEGFGISASYSYTDSELTTASGASSTAIPGYSETVSNVAAWYDRGGFSARISNRYRSDFLAEVTGFGANRDFRNANEESVVDAQIGYNWEDGPLEGLGIVLQGYNLTDERFGTFLNNDQRQVKDFQQYGATYLLGVNYNF